MNKSRSWFFETNSLDGPVRRKTNTYGKEDIITGTGDYVYQDGHTFENLREPTIGKPY